MESNFRIEQSVEQNYGLPAPNFEPLFNLFFIILLVIAVCAGIVAIIRNYKHPYFFNNLLIASTINGLLSIVALIISLILTAQIIRNVSAILVVLIEIVVIPPIIAIFIKKKLKINYKYFTLATAYPIYIIILYLLYNYISL